MPIELGSMITLQQAADNFSKLLVGRLKSANTDAKKITEYKNSIHRAVRHCEECFNGEFSRFGGQFTSHGPDHAARVLAAALHLGGLLTGSLSIREFFLLGMSAILHDIGMTAPLPEDIAQSNDDSLRWQARRKRHGEATADEIRQCKSLIEDAAKPDPEAYFTYLPHLCAAHCTANFPSHVTQLRDLARNRFASERYPVLAGILLLADELDISCVRAAPDKGKYREFRGSITKAHWWKHWLVARVILDGANINIVCLNEGAADLPEGVREFQSWTVAKLKAQLELLQYHLDPNGTEPVWQCVINLTHTKDVWWKDDLPELKSEIIEAAQEERLKIPGQRVHRVINPERLIKCVAQPNEIVEASEFYRTAIFPRIKHFRGQGRHASSAEARRLYVEKPRNMSLMDGAIKQWLHSVTQDIDQGVNLRLYSGEIGEGKSHFLSVFLHEIKARYPVEYEKTITVRAELTECNPNSLLEAKRFVAKALYEALENLELVTKIRGIMERDYSKGVPLPIPLLKEETVTWQREQIDSFIQACGMLCKANSRIRAELGDQAPVALCIFLDNSDHLSHEIVPKLYQWCNNISGNAGALVWMFLRPDTFAFLKATHESAPYCLREPEPITGPTLKEVIDKRLATFPGRFGAKEVVKIRWNNNMTFSPTDITAAVSYLANLALRTADDMLPKLTEQPRGHGPNLRAGLQALMGILGSHVMTDGEYATALALQKAVKGPDAHTDYIPSVERWPKVLEALILGIRVWSSPECGVVENLFDPPEVQEYGDYFLMLHCLQMLPSDGKLMNYGELCSRMEVLGYDRRRVHPAIRHLAARRVVVDDGPLDGRTFPLVAVSQSDHSVYPDKMSLRATPWGVYHVEKLIYQAQYWKHMFYNIVMKASLVRTLDISAVHAQRADALRNQLDIVFTYLSGIEDSWIYGKSEAILRRFGICPVIETIRNEIFRQLT